MIKIAFIFSAISINALASPIIDNLGRRVVGGSNARDGDYPYQISLRYKGSHCCGGSIIDDNLILTAAHCVQGVSVPLLDVIIGTNQLNSGGLRYTVKQIISHANHDPNTKKNDIAILKLHSSIKYNSKVAKIDLEDSYIQAGDSVVLSGWGSTSYPGSTPNDLQYLILETISNSDCQSKHGTSRNIYDSQICTFNNNMNGEGACHGDSGGPLVSIDGKLCGIVSWGRPCGVGYPDVFTRVSSYLDWIKANSS